MPKPVKATASVLEEVKGELSKKGRTLEKAKDAPMPKPRALPSSRRKRPPLDPVIENAVKYDNVMATLASLEKGLVSSLGEVRSMIAMIGSYGLEGFKPDDSIPF